MALLYPLAAWGLLTAAVSANPQASLTTSSTGDSPFSFGTGSPMDSVNSNPTDSASSFDSSQPSASLSVTSTVIVSAGPVATFTIAGLWGDQLQAGSLIGLESDLTTMAVTCAAPAGPQQCIYTNPVTMTAGPSTLHWSIVYDDSYTVDESCSYSSGGASCTWTAEGIASHFPHSGPDITSTGRSTSVSSQTFENSLLNRVPVILTAGDTEGVSTATVTVTDYYPVEVVDGTPTSYPSSADQTDTSQSTSSLLSSSARITPAASKTSNNAPTLAPAASIAGLFAGLLAYAL